MTDARIVPDIARPRDPTEVRVAPSMVPVWALIGYWRAVNCNAVKVCVDYAISTEEMEAALAYHASHRAEIDVRLLQNG